MNWIDAAVSYMSPERGVRRARARQLLEDAVRAAQSQGKADTFRHALQKLSYEAAQAGRRMDGWFRPGTSANSEISAASKVVRDGARAAVRDMPLAAKGMLEFENKAVGTGIRPQARTNDLEINKIVDEAFEQFAEQTGYWKNQRVAARCIVEAGEGLVRHRYRFAGDGTKVRARGKTFEIPYYPQLLEPDFLDSTKDGQTDTGYQYQGIEFDKIGRRKGYWLFASHPGDNTNTGWFSRSSWQSAFVPVGSVEHGYRQDRIGQERGISWLAPILATLHDLDGYEDAERVRKRGEACLMAFVTEGTEENPDNVLTGTSTTDTLGRRIEEMAPGMVGYLPPNSSVTMAEPKANPGYGEYIVTQQRMIAAGWGIMFELLSGNLSQTNYSSYRSGAISFKDFIEAFQWITLIPFVGDPIYQRFFDSCRVVGLIPADTVYGVEWGPPAFDLLDRGAEAEADYSMVRIGSMTWPQMVARQGHDPEKQFQDIVTWKKKFDDAGVVLDCDPSKTARNGIIQQPAEQQAARLALHLL